MPGLENRTATKRIEDVLLNAVALALRERKYSVANVAALRAIPTTGAGGTQALTDGVLAAVDGVGLYARSKSSSAADDGALVIQGTTDGANGRWLKCQNPGGTTTPLMLRGDDVTTLSSGYLRQVDYYEGQFDDEETIQRTFGQAPCVLVDFIDRAKTRASTKQGALNQCDFHFQLWIVDFNARGNLTASRGSTVAAEAEKSPGAYAIAGDLEDLLDGVMGEQLGETAIGFARTGTLTIIEKQLVGRRVIMGLDLGVWATTGKRDPDATPLAGISGQMQQATPAGGPADQDNAIVSGLGIALGLGLTRAPRAGAARIGGATVTVAAPSAHTFPAWSDTFRDLAPDGTFTYASVAFDGDAPAVAAGSLRIGRTRTNSGGVTDDLLLAATLRDDGSPFTVAPSP